MNTDRRGFMRFLSAGTAAAGITTQMLQAEALGKSAVTHEFLKQQHVDDARFNYEADRLDLVSWALYDRVTIPASFVGVDVTALPAFTFVQDGNGWRGLNETNMYTARNIPAPNMMRIERIFFIFDPENAPEDMATFRREVAWEFFIGCKIFAQSTMMESSTQGRFSEVVRENGYPTGMVPVDTLVLNPALALMIHHQESFYVGFCSKKLVQMSKPFSFYVFLDGVQARAVQ